MSEDTEDEQGDEDYRGNGSYRLRGSDEADDGLPDAKELGAADDDHSESEKPGSRAQVQRKPDDRDRQYDNRHAEHRCDLYDEAADHDLPGGDRSDPQTLKDAEFPVPGQGERVSRNGNKAHARHQGRSNAKLGAAQCHGALAGGQDNEIDHGKDQGPQ